MVIGRNNESVKIMVEGDKVEQVDELKFFRSINKANDDCTKEIEKRIAMATEKTVQFTVQYLEIKKLTSH